MTSGGEEHLAPVIPLFGAAQQPPQQDASADEVRPVVPRRTGDDGVWRSSWDEGAEDSLSAPSERHPAYGGRRAPQPHLQAVDRQGAGRVHHLPHQTDADAPSDPSELRHRAEDALVRRLRARALSVSEARSVLREQGLDSASIEDVIDDFERRRYLDDRTLAGHLVTSGVERKGQGRVALSRALAQRGIPRDVIDEALEELPDDDAERALEYARSKARSMARLEPEVALRRLVGQLARRGYGGSVAQTAARTALNEASRSGSVSRVRFTDSD